MNYKKWSKLKFWIVIAIMFFLGMIVAPKNPIKEVIKEVTVDKIVIKEVPTDKIVTKEVVKEVPAQCDYSVWETLKSTDDIGFNYFSDFANLCSRGFYAASELDIDEMDQVSGEIEDLTVKISSLAEIRQSLLIKLGY